MHPRLAFVLASAVVLSAFASTAFAHISLERGGTHMSRYGDAYIKDAPCGTAGGARGSNVYTYEPGETITVTFDEFIPHPGYFRIAFDDDGDDDFEDPASIDPISRACLSDPTDQCGESDFFNNDTVLMDNLDPHTSGGGLRTYEVTLPDVECDNCTLQIIQVMEDTVHGPYNPSSSGISEVFYVEDIYHTCIDLVLKRTGGTTGGAGGDMPSGGTGGDPAAAGTGGQMDAAGAGGSAGDPAPTAGTGAAPAPPTPATPEPTAGSAPAPAAGAGAAGAPAVAGNAPAPAPGPTAGTAAPTAGAGPAATTGGGSSGGCSVPAPASAPTPLAWLALAGVWLALRRRA